MEKIYQEFFLKNAISKHCVMHRYNPVRSVPIISLEAILKTKHVLLEAMLGSDMMKN